MYIGRHPAKIVGVSLLKLNSHVPSLVVVPDRQMALEFT
jgi:hypothetical protein